MRILFHGQFSNGAREILSDQTIPDNVDQELSVPDGTKWIQVFFTPRQQIADMSDDELMQGRIDAE